MAAFRIWCRTQEVGDGHYLATVCAVPATELDGIGALTSESRLLPDADSATAECARMAQAVLQRVLAQGHAVVAIDSV
jgi:hypothetical protein